MRPNTKSFVFIVFLVFFASSTLAATLHHQGAVTVKGERFNGPGAFRFALVDPASNAYFWVNDGGAVAFPDAPVNAVTLTVLNGVYNVTLGDDSLANMTAIPGGIFNENDILALRVWFDDLHGGGLHRLFPDLPLSTAPYARIAESAEQLTIPGSAASAATVDAAGNVTIPAALTVNGAVSGPGFAGWDTEASNDVTMSTNFGGDVSGTFDAMQVADDSHIHSDSTIADSHDHTDATVADMLSIDNGRLFAPAGAGNVGIGTNTPNARLHVVNGAIMPAIGNSPGAGIFFPPDPGGGSGDSAFMRYYVVQGDDANLDIGTTNDGNDGIRFMHAFQPRMVIRNGVGIGTDSPTAPLEIVSGTIQAPIGSGWHVLIRNDNPFRTSGMRVSDAGFFEITSNTNENGFARLSATHNWTVVSDARSKTDVHPLTGVLQKAMALKPVSFRFKEAVKTHGDAAPTEIGFIAQDVRELFPSLVVDGSDVLTMNYAGLSVVAIAALQEQQTEIAAQRTQLAAQRTQWLAEKARITGHQTELDRLRRENEDLRARLDRLESKLSDRVADAAP
ncbi:MAG: hypothetical protein HOP29_10520 [Phycisphaerales bacterium]|nr:hypothetical protein [Phycisphaerales bacterium]